MKRILVYIKNSDPFMLLPAVIAGSTVFIICITLLVFYSKLPNHLPLFYSLPWGSSQLVNKQQFLLLPAVLLLMTLTNSFLASRLHPIQYPLKRILTVSTVLLSLIILATSLRILYIFI